MTGAFHNNNFPVYVHKKERADFNLLFQYILSISLTGCLFVCPSIYVASIQHNCFIFILQNTLWPYAKCLLIIQ